MELNLITHLMWYWFLPTHMPTGLHTFTPMLLFSQTKIFFSLSGVMVPTLGYKRFTFISRIVAKSRFGDNFLDPGLSSFSTNSNLIKHPQRESEKLTLIKLGLAQIFPRVIRAIRVRDKISKNCWEMRGRVAFFFTYSGEWFWIFAFLVASS